MKQKYKVQKRVKEHDRKLKKAQKRGGLPPGKKKRDPGIPNSWPIKQELLEQVERAKAKKEQDREAAKQAKKERRKLAKQGLSMEQLAAFTQAMSLSSRLAHFSAIPPWQICGVLKNGTPLAVKRS